MKERVRRLLQTLLHLRDTPHRTALAFGIGLWIAFCPLLGLHTIMALAIAFAFGLNRVAILAGAYVNNPWTLAPLYLAGTAVGCYLLGIPTSALAAVDFDLHGLDLAGFLRQLQPYLRPFVVGNTVLGIVAGVLGYLGLRALIERRHRTPRAPQSGGAAA